MGHAALRPPHMLDFMGHLEGTTYAAMEIIASLHALGTKKIMPV